MLEIDINGISVRMQLFFKKLPTSKLSYWYNNKVGGIRVNAPSSSALPPPLPILSCDLLQF